MQHLVARHGVHAAAELQDLRLHGAYGAQDGRQHRQIAPWCREQLVGDGVQHIGVGLGDVVVAQHYLKQIVATVLLSIDGVR